MLRSTVVESDAVVFNRDAATLNFGRGSVTLAYRPVGFEGRIAPSQLTIGLNFRRTGPVCLPGADQTARIDPADLRPLGDRSVQAC